MTALPCGTAGFDAVGAVAAGPVLSAALPATGEGVDGLVAPLLPDGVGVLGPSP